MKTAKLQGFLRKSWLCPCLICLLTSCAALQKPAQEQIHFRVTITLAPGSSDTALNAVLASVAASHVAIRYYDGGADEPGFSLGTHVVNLTLATKKSVELLRERLQVPDVLLTGLIIHQIN